jgi:hypothetical protein
MTTFSDITAAVVAALVAANVAGGRVYRGHAWPLPEGDASMVWVRPERATSDRTGISGGPIDWTTTLMINVRARYTPDTQSADEAVDALLALVFSTLAAAAIADVQSVVPGGEIAWDYGEADVNVAGAWIRLDVIHRTISTALTAW